MTRLGHTRSGMISRQHVMRGALSCCVSPKDADHGVGRGDLETIRRNRERNWKWLVQEWNVEYRIARKYPQVCPCLAV